METGRHHQGRKSNNMPDQQDRETRQWKKRGQEIRTKGSHRTCYICLSLFLCWWTDTFLFTPHSFLLCKLSSRHFLAFCSMSCRFLMSSLFPVNKTTRILSLFLMISRLQPLNPRIPEILYVWRWIGWSSQPQDHWCSNRWRRHLWVPSGSWSQRKILNSHQSQF